MSLPSERGTEADEGYERLHQAILRGDFQPNERLLQIANHKTATRLIQHLHIQHVRSQFRLILVPGRPQRSVAEHRAIVEAVASRDPEAAEAAMRYHRANTVETLRTLAGSRQLGLR
jgi:DNA-binding GntR family transcriptional regulator